MPIAARSAVTLVLAAAALSTTPCIGAAQADDIVVRSRKMYASLKSYADTGAVVTEEQVTGGPMLVERHRFVTFYEGPRRFFHDFNEDPKAGGDRVVVWSDGGAFNTWWATTGVHDVYEQGRGANAFALTALPTKGSVMQVPPLLFSTAGLHGPLSDFASYRVVGAETVAGRKTEKVAGEVLLAFKSGYGNARPTTIWIDSETLFVVKVVEETPPQSPRGTIMRSTTTFSAHANPTLTPDRFTFAVPK